MADKTQLRAIRDALNDLRNQADIVKAMLDNVEPDPPKPVGVIATPGMRVLYKPAANYSGRTVISRTAWERMAGVTPNPVYLPVVDDKNTALQDTPTAYYTLYGDPITGYEDD